MPFIKAFMDSLSGCIEVESSHIKDKPLNHATTVKLIFPKS